MSSIPANIGRVPNLLSSQVLLSNLTRTNLSLLDIQTQIATNRRVNRFSDDAIAATSISVLDNRLSLHDQRLRNLSNAESSLNLLDSVLGSASDLVLEAKSIASEQIGATSDTVTRNTTAVAVDGMIRSLLLANRETNNVHAFGGSTPGFPPIQELRGGYRYIARGPGLYTDIDSADDIPITLGGHNALGETSARLQSTNDLNPNLTADTRLRDLNGARDLGVTAGVFAFSFNGGPQSTVDLSGADTAQDAADALTAAIRQYETDNSVVILDSGGVSFSGGSLSIDVVAGTPDPQLTFTDIGTGVTAQDLGLTASPFEATNSVGTDLDPKITLLTPLSAVSGLTVPLDSIRFRFTSGSTSEIVDVDLSSAQTIDEIRNLIETQVDGVRVEVNASGTGLNIYNEIAGPGLSIEEVPGGSSTATELGIRTLSAGTAVTHFNNGRGVRIVDGAIDPVTGAPDPDRDVDFRISLGNGQAFDVDLRPQDLVNVQSILDRINAEFATAITEPPVNASAPALVAGDFSAGLTDGANGIALTQTVTGGPIAVEARNNSAAAEDLGFRNGVYDTPSATFVAQDRATVRVDNIFTALIDLRNALRADSSSGITVAGGSLDDAIDRLAGTRALVGVYARRVDQATDHLEETIVLDKTIKSQLQDLDLAEASVRFTLLQTQLQATLAVGAQSQQLSLLNFLT